MRKYKKCSKCQNGVIKKNCLGCSNGQTNFMTWVGTGRQTCGTCHGRGYFQANCTYCNGSGRQRDYAAEGQDQSASLNEESSRSEIGIAEFLGAVFILYVFTYEPATNAVDAVQEWNASTFAFPGWALVTAAVFVGIIALVGFYWIAKLVLYLVGILLKPALVLTSVAAVGWGLAWYFGWV